MTEVYWAGVILIAGVLALSALLVGLVFFTAWLFSKHWALGISFLGLIVLAFVFLTPGIVAGGIPWMK